MRHVFYKRADELTPKGQWYLHRYTAMSDTLRVAHALKEAYCEWLVWAKTSDGIVEVNKRLQAFYRKVEETKLPAFLK